MGSKPSGPVFLPECQPELYGFRNHLLDFNLHGANERHFTRDEFVQFLGIVVSGKQGECVWGEVFERLRISSHLVSDPPFQMLT